jgi:Metal-dependent hydrolase
MNNIGRSVAATIITLLIFPMLLQCGRKEIGPLHIMSYNVRNCKGMDNVVDFDRVADVINRAAPDVVALQELDSATQRYSGTFVLKELAERTSMHATFAPAIEFQEGRYGVGILSKTAPLSFRQIPLPGDEKRTFLIAEFNDYYFCCTHLDLEQQARMESVSIILETIKAIKKPLILAGDMNAEYGSAEQVALCKKFTILNNYTQNTFPADNPEICIDFVYGYNNGYNYTVGDSKVLEEPMASDHRPLIVDIYIKKL